MYHFLFIKNETKKENDAVLSSNNDCNYKILKILATKIPNELNIKGDHFM